MKVFREFWTDRLGEIFADAIGEPRETIALAVAFLLLILASCRF
jgi:hypothetical protein